MDELLIIMGVVVFYDLFKIIYNAVRIVFLKKEVKKFLKIDLIFGVICTFGWLNSLRTSFFLIPNQIFHIICYFTVIFIFLIKKENKKMNDYFLFAMITIDLIVILIILYLFGFYFIIFILATIFVLGVIILRNNKGKLKDFEYLMLSLLDGSNIILSYIILIVSVATIF